MSNHEYTVEFRIIGLDPARITKELNLQPCQTRIAGSQRFSGRIDPNMWGYDGSDGSYVAWGSLEEGLVDVLDKLWSQREIIAKYKVSGAHLIWWCGHFYSGFDGGPSLSAELLSKLGEFGAELFIDNYHQDDEPKA